MGHKESVQTNKQKPVSIQVLSEFYQETLQPQTTKQPMAPRGQDTGHVIYSKCSKISITFHFVNSSPEN